MKQSTNKKYEERQKYKAEKAKGHILLPDTVRFICEANGYDAEKIGQHLLIHRSIRPAATARSLRFMQQTRRDLIPGSIQRSKIA